MSSKPKIADLIRAEAEASDVELFLRCRPVLPALIEIAKAARKSSRLQECWDVVGNQLVHSCACEDPLCQAVLAFCWEGVDDAE